MTAPHFFCRDVASGRLRISGDDARHAVRSLRLRPGEPITVSDGRGTVAIARVVEAGDDLVAEVTGRRTVPPAFPRLVVFQALPKSGKLDDVVRKLTEIGVDEIVPWRAARSVVRWDPLKAQAQIARLRAIAREAAMQSRRAWLPEVRDLAAIDDVPAGAIVLHEEADLRLGALLPAQAPPLLTLVVGPEGGLAPEEVSGLRDQGASVGSLGDPILRTETAAMVATALVLGAYGRIG